MERTRIKICGLTNREDIRAAVDYGADALGFILVPESPRYVGNSPQLPSLLMEAPPLVTCVGVCRNLREIGPQYAGGFQAAQFYDLPGELSSWPSESGLRLIYAGRIRDENSLQALATTLPALATPTGTRRICALVLDTYHQDRLGGSGETFNWELALEAKRRFGLPIILAGGLTPENVAEAVACVRPYAVDVSSGVEAEPGRKDHAKLKAFCRAVRSVPPAA
jgi:phosphoribosylanthranilate isomerase